MPADQERAAVDEARTGGWPPCASRAASLTAAFLSIGPTRPESLPSGQRQADAVLGHSRRLGYCSDTAERARLGCVTLPTIVTPSGAVSIPVLHGRTPLRARIPPRLAIKEHNEATSHFYLR